MNKLVSVACLVASVTAFPRPQAPAPGPGGLNFPAPHTFEWGYRRGNPDHNREQYLSQKDHTFKAKLKWHDGYEGHGEHYFDYNHVGPKEHHAAPAYAPPTPAPPSPRSRPSPILS